MFRVIYVTQVYIGVVYKDGRYVVKFICEKIMGLVDGRILRGLIDAVSSRLCDMEPSECVVDDRGWKKRVWNFKCNIYFGKVTLIWESKDDGRLWLLKDDERIAKELREIIESKPTLRGVLAELNEDKENVVVDESWDETIWV